MTLDTTPDTVADTTTPETDTRPDEYRGLSGTYSPEDNKLRLYAAARLPRELYERVRAAGFIWAPKQDLFVAPTWTPGREDFLIELCGDIDDEDRSLVSRAEQRADRFDGYSDRRAADAERARRAVAAIADNIPFGQPILVGHHSERHARRDAEKIETGMRKAVKMWSTSKYWTDRAKGAIAHAKYKELPTVRARRIKTIESDKRKVERSMARVATLRDGWRSVQSCADPEKQRSMALALANHSHFSQCWPLDKYPRQLPAKQYEGEMGLWSALDGNVIDAAQAADLAVRLYQPSARSARWIAHYENRLAYERAMLAAAGASHLLTPPPRPTQLQLCNYRAPQIEVRNPYCRGETMQLAQIEMTKADYAGIYNDYKGTRDVGGTHRVRTAMRRLPSDKHQSLYCVFLTDSKVHEVPPPKAAPVQPAVDPAIAELDAADAAKAVAAKPMPVPVPKTAPSAAPTQDDLFGAMRASLKAGVKVVTAPQLFPTPRDLGSEMADLAEIAAGMDVLEPSAGTGALVTAILEHQPAARVAMVEINAALAHQLGRDFAPKPDADGAYFADIMNLDFLAYDPSPHVAFDRIVMNPPFENASDIKHILHALRFLKPGGKLVALCANGCRQQAALRPRAAYWRDLPPNTFAGTGVRAALLVIEKESA